MTKRLLAFALIFHVVSIFSVASRSQSIPHCVGIRISSSKSADFARAFTALRPQNDFAFSHTDISSVRLTDDALIASLLNTSGLHGVTLRPMFPTHSVAFQDIRQRSNPSLFSSQLAFSKDVNGLRDAEDKISRWFILTFTDSLTPEAAVALLKKSSAIEIAEPRYIRRSLFVPNDPHFSEQFNLSLMHVSEAWDIVRCDSTMLLAVDDVGTDWTHEDLGPNIAINWGEVGVDTNGLDKRANGIDDDGNGFIDDWHGWDFAGQYNDSPDNDTRSPDDHGTHTAGIMDAASNNGKGIAGVAFAAKLLPLKTAGDFSGSLDFAFQGLIYAADMHAKACNCSFGGYNYAQAEQDAVDYCVSKDCAVVAASGNDSAFKDVYPGAYHHVLDVGSATATGSYAYYADYNTHVSVFAPGGEQGQQILSTLPGNKYGDEYGTSMASPAACGVIGLVRQRFPSMTALQACQQVRATSVAQPVDSMHLGFVGHGLVNALAAVTDTNTHSVRIEHLAIHDDLKLSRFLAGESGSIALTVQNFLKPVKQLWASLEVIQGADAITFDKPTVFFGAIGTNDTIQNTDPELRLHVAENSAPNTKVTVRVVFHDTLVGYGPDIDYFTFVVNPTYFDLNANNLTVTFSSYGTIGYNDPIADNQGSGFQWSKPPANIGPLARSVLFNGGLMVGADPAHVVDVVVADQNSIDRDFSTVTPIVSATPDHGAAQELVCAYSDANADTANQVGVSVRQRAYAFTQGLAANAAIVQYILRKTQSSIATDNSAAALYMDWDIGLSGALNMTRYDGKTAVNYRLEPNYPYVGVSLISALPQGSMLNYHAIRNDGSQGDITTYGGFDRGQKWRSMTDTFPAAGPGDISMTLGLKDLPLASSDSIELTIVFALAESADKLDETVDAAKAAWGVPASVSAPHNAQTLTAYPNPFSNHIEIAWPHEGNAWVTLYDALGREVIQKNITGNSYSLWPHVPAGVYTLEVSAGRERYVRTLVSNGLF